MSTPIKTLVFLIITGGLAWVSRASLRDVRSHGFYRFFAWEAITALILLNVERWFTQPFSPNQVVSWILLIISLFLVIPGMQLLRKAGKPDQQRSDPGLVGIEKTTELVTTGLYGYIRHPLYSSLLFLAWGVFFKHISWAATVLVCLASSTLWITAKIEERENIAYFGTAYEGYMRRTKMFIPFLL